MIIFNKYLSGFCTKFKSYKEELLIVFWDNCKRHIDNADKNKKFLINTVFASFFEDKQNNPENYDIDKPLVIPSNHSVFLFLKKNSEKFNFDLIDKT